MTWIDDNKRPLMAVSAILGVAWFGGRYFDKNQSFNALDMDLDRSDCCEVWVEKLYDDGKIGFGQAGDFLFGIETGDLKCSSLGSPNCSKHDSSAEMFDAERIQYNYTVHREPKGSSKGGWFKSKKAETFEAKGGFDRNCKVCKGTGWMPKKGDPKDAKTAKLLGVSIDELTMQPCNAGGKDMGCFNAETFEAKGDSEAHVVWKLKGKYRPDMDWAVIGVFNDKKDAVNASKNYNYGVFEEWIGMEEDDERGAEGFEANTLDPRNYLSKRKPYGYMRGGLSPTPSGKYRDLEPSQTKIYTFTYSAMKDGKDHLDEEGNKISVFAHTPKEALYMATQDLRLRENTSIYDYHINPTYSLDNDYNRENRLVSFGAETLSTESVDKEALIKSEVDVKMNELFEFVQNHVDAEDGAGGDLYDPNGLDEIENAVSDYFVGYWDFESRHNSNNPRYQNAETFEAIVGTLNSCPECDESLSGVYLLDNAYGTQDRVQSCKCGWSEVEPAYDAETFEAKGDCEECYGTGGLYDSHMGINDECHSCGGTGFDY